MGYLVLGRHVDEKVIITVPPSDRETVIEVLVVGMRYGHPDMADNVRLGFDAPRDVRIDRAEIYELRKQETE